MGDADAELMEIQRRKSRPMVAISEFIFEDDEQPSPMYVKSGNTGTHKEVTHVEV